MLDNIYIIVIGKTGSGKSSFINAVLGEHVAPTNTSQQAGSSTHDISQYEFELPDGRRVVLVETPGLDGYAPSSMVPTYGETVKLIHDFAETITGPVFLMAIYNIGDQALQADLEYGYANYFFSNLLWKVSKIFHVTTHWDQIDDIDPIFDKRHYNLFLEDSLIGYLSKRYPYHIRRSGAYCNISDFYIPRAVVYDLLDVDYDPNINTVYHGQLYTGSAAVTEASIYSESEASEVPTEHAEEPQPSSTSVGSGTMGRNSPDMSDLMQQLQAITKERDELAAHNAQLLTENARMKFIATSTPPMDGSLEPILEVLKPDTIPFISPPDWLTKDQRSTLESISQILYRFQTLRDELCAETETFFTEQEGLRVQGYAAAAAVDDAKAIHHEIREDIDLLVKEHSRLVGERDLQRRLDEEFIEELDRLEARRSGRRRGRESVDLKTHVETSLDGVRANVAQTEKRLAVIEQDYERGCTELKHQASEVNRLNMAYNTRSTLAYHFASLPEHTSLDLIRLEDDHKDDFHRFATQFANVSLLSWERRQKSDEPVPSAPSDSQTELPDDSETSPPNEVTSNTLELDAFCDGPFHVYLAKRALIMAMEKGNHSEALSEYEDMVRRLEEARTMTTRDIRIHSNPTFSPQIPTIPVTSPILIQRTYTPSNHVDIPSDQSQAQESIASSETSSPGRVQPLTLNVCTK